MLMMDHGSDMPHDIDLPVALGLPVNVFKLSADCVW